jgi:excisionase family DNA binding protein
MKDTTIDTALLAPQDAARLIGVSAQRIRQLHLEGRLPALRDSAGRRLFRRKDVERLRREREQARAARSGAAPEPPPRAA